MGMVGTAARKGGWLILMLIFWNCSLVSSVLVLYLFSSDSLFWKVASIPLGLLSLACLVVGLRKWWEDY